MDVEGELAVLAARTTLGYVRCWDVFVDVLPDGWADTAAGAIACFSGAPIPTVNGVWIIDAHPDVRAVEAMLERLAATGVPYCVQARPEGAPVVAQLATDRGMRLDEQIPLMALTELRPIVPTELLIREVGVDEADVFIAVMARAFGAPQDAVAKLLPPQMFASDLVRFYLGELAGEPVCVGTGSLAAAGVGVFNIGTVPEACRRGFGAAITARVVADGLDAGAEFAWLQSSESGFPVYERIGFRHLESWPCWVSPDA